MIKQIAEHRSVRQYKDKAVEKTVVEQILAAAVRASTVGNMQLYSIVVSQDKEMLKRLSPCHFSQPAATTAPLLMTFCADVHRFSRWCELRDTEPAYDNFCWFMNGVTDCLLASQNASLEAEAHGLGICYLGTTLYNAGEIAEILKLPQGVIPIMTVAMGYPSTEVGLTDRLPLDAVVHYETYEDYSDERINEIWKARETSEETKRLLEENGLPNLAKIFTERRYVAADNVAFSKKYFNELVERGFFKQ